MTNLPGALGTIFDLLLVVVGFGLIVFVHELGHFLAAKWAGIRVLAFALGFGPAVVSYRKGMGLRRGSTEREYHRLIEAQGPTIAVSPTEYRLNWLPLGGYVKMLGQEDLHPGATSSAPDSYQSCPPWRRMVVISAGVAMNIVTAAALFIIVFMIGLRTEPPRIGAVAPRSPAAAAEVIHAADPRVGPGLQGGDVVLEVNGRRPNSFNDLMLAAAMSRREARVALRIHRPGLDEPVQFHVKPERGRLTGLLEMGVEPPRSAKLPPARAGAEGRFQEVMEALGIPGVRPGMSLVRIDGDTDIRAAHDLTEAARASDGRPLELEFASEDGHSVIHTLAPTPVYQSDVIAAGPREVAIEHLLGLTPVLMVAGAEEARAAQGLRPGDIFARVGSVEFPSFAQGIAEIRRHSGEEISLVVLRQTAQGPTEVPLTASVSRAGLIGFAASDTRDHATILAQPPLIVDAPDAKPRPTPAASLALRPGERIVSVDGREVASFAQLRAALRDSTAAAVQRLDESHTVGLVLELPLTRPGSAAAPPREARDWTLTLDDMRTLHALGWASPIPVAIFEPDRNLLRAGHPGEAIRMGLHETKRVMLMTYITFARLFEGTVRVEHLKGPVGIATLGTRIAERGFIWLLFFLALISVNLAVINFLPLPVVDGGQFLFLVFEQVRGRPAPVGFQNAVTALGLLLIGAVFLLVTFNDIVALFGG